jgi:hypothetical protein
MKIASSQSFIHHFMRQRGAFLIASSWLCLNLASSTPAAAAVPLAGAAAQTEVVDVRTFGATLNGVTDDSAAIRAAFHSMLVNGHPQGTLLIPAGTAFLASGLDFNLGYPDPADNYGAGTGEHFAFITQGVLKPKPGIGTAVRVHNGYSPTVDIHFFGGGSVRDVGLAIDSLVGPSIAVEGRMFGGTVLKADATGDTTKRIRAVNFVSVIAINCGQAIQFLYIEAFGQIANIVDWNNKNGSYFAHCADIGITHYENYSPPSQTVGLYFYRCNGMHLDTISLGDSATEALMKIEGGDFGYIHELRAGGFKANVPGSGLELVDVSSLDIGLLETFVSSKGLYIHGCGSVGIGSHRSLTGDNNAVFITAGNAYPTCNLNITKVMYNYTGNEAIRVDQSVTGGYLFLGGQIQMEQVSNPAKGYTISSASNSFQFFAEGLFKVYRSYLLKAFNTPDNAALVHVRGGSVGNWP